MRTLVIGLGNPLLCDDSVGLHVIDALRSRLNGTPDVELDVDHWGGLRLMERMIGYDRAIVVDAIRTGAPPGTIHFLATDDVPTQRSASAHDATLTTALELGRRAGMPLPASEDILLIGIEADDMTTFSETCTPRVTDAIGRAAKAVEHVLQKMRDLP
jgi:hydrogenase maturation protease